MSKKKDELKRLLNSGNFILFLGAGASVEAGIPTWSSALDQLRDKIEHFSHAYANVMKEEIAKGRLLEAAEFLYMADWTDEDRANALSEVFGPTPRITPRLRMLAELPYRSVVTTNFDRSFIESATKCSIPLFQFTEGADDLSAARLCRERYILRLHGRIEVPSSIVLAHRHYSALEKKPEYAYFAQSLITDNSVVFFGFSFDDPFFVATLEAISQATGGRMRHKSHALLASEPSGKLRDLFQRLNIDTVLYSSKDNHEEAWNLLASAKGVQIVPGENNSEKRLRQTLAWVLAHLRIRNDQDLQAAVFSAAVLAELSALGSLESVEVATDAVRQRLGLPPQYSGLVKEALGMLSRQNRIRISSGLVSVAPEETPSDNEQQLSRLSKGVMARASARYNIILSPKYDYRQPLQELLLRILVADGMILAHSFVCKKDHSSDQIQNITESAIEAMPSLERRRLKPLEKAVISLLDRPEPDEEELLDQLASTTFTLCTTLVEPSVLTIAQLLSERTVYLDASVLLPWLSSGHPTENVSKSIVENIGEPTVPDFYLNEIVAHRVLAIREYKDAELHDSDRFKNYARIYGLQNINAYLGGYGGSISKDFKGSLNAYLEQFAPYTNESEAKQFLEKKGIAVISPRFDQAHVSHFLAAIKNRLQDSCRYRNDTRIKHDATMLAMLLVGPSNSRPYFVTADKVLITTVAESRLYREILPFLLLPYQAAHLAQMIKGGSQVIQGLSRTIFGIRRDDIDTLREFYVDRILDHYEPALVNEIPDIVNAISMEAQKLSKLGVFTVTESDVSERVSRFKTFDQFESLFHEKMIKALRKYGL